MRIEFKMPALIDDTRINLYIELLSLSKQYCQNGEEIVINWSRTKEISPAGYAILSCILDHLIEQHNLIINKNISNKISLYPVVKLFNNVSASKKLHPVELTDFENNLFFAKGSNGVIDLSITNKFDSKFEKAINEDLFYDCKLILNELIQNSIAHSGSERYYVYAGFYKQEFSIGVLDMGISIPAKLKQKYYQKNDADYINFAMVEGTTTRRNRTGGYGLYYTFDLLKQNKGILVIVSGKAEIRRYFKSRKVKIHKLNKPLPGTWCFNKFEIEE